MTNSPDPELVKSALLYLIARCEREFKQQDQPPELDFVILAVNEVKDKLGL